MAQSTMETNYASTGMDLSLQSTDLQILQDSFDSLFTSSLLFETQSLTELLTALA